MVAPFQRCGENGGVFVRRHNVVFFFLGIVDSCSVTPTEVFFPGMTIGPKCMRVGALESL